MNEINEREIQLAAFRKTAVQAQEENK